MFEKVNLEKALYKERNVQKEKNESQLISQFKSLFEAEWENEKRVLQTLKKGAISSDLPSPRNLEESKIYSLDNIKALCIDYRLRFLSTKQFKGDLPQSALTAVKRTEEKVGDTIDAFMIAAPSDLFKLEDSNKDPLLFAPLEDGRYYLVHQWGNDMAWHRKILNWPVRSPMTLLISVLSVAILLTAVIPSNMLSSSGEFFNFMRIVALGWNIIFLLGITSYFWFASHAKFSIHAWRSKHFN